MEFKENTKIISGAINAVLVSEGSVEYYLASGHR